ncbi:MAG: PQQ-like beta-propeller repeat protein, partial [Kosmotogaceae bacterium]|nr:PQQ-like beta-propeller repeat protein [Kosmotogaceae bacterium]
MKLVAICLIVSLFLLSGCFYSGVDGSFQFSSPVIGRNGEVFVNTMDTIFSFTSSPDTYRKVFSLQSAGGEWFSCDPSIDIEGNLYIGTTSGRLMKLSSEGVVHWSFGGTEEAGASTVRGSPSFDAFGNVYFGTYGGVLYCISSGGKELWNFETGREIWSKPAVGVDGTVFFGTLTTGGSDSNYFFAVNGGELLWRYETETISSGFYSSPAIGEDGTVYSTCHDGYLYSFDPVDGSEKWKLQIAENPDNSAIAASPVVGDKGLIFACTYNGQCSAISKEGSLIWRTELEDEIVATPISSSDGTLYVIVRGEAKIFQL